MVCQYRSDKVYFLNINLPFLLNSEILIILDFEMPQQDPGLIGLIFFILVIRLFLRLDSCFGLTVITSVAKIYLLIQLSTK